MPQYELDASNPEDRAVIEAARSFGVAPSIFLGRESGPPWTHDDRAAALSLLVWERGLCPGCRQPMAETTNPDNETRYRAEVPLRCHYCVASEIGMDRYQDDPHSSALHIAVVLHDEEPE